MRTIRLESLRKLIDTRGALEVDVASAELGVSRETIRRDLGELAAQGLIRRTRGGAAALHYSLTELDITQRVLENGPQKVAIARYAVNNFVEDGMSIALDGGTTALEFARCLAGRKVTIITASIAIVNELALSGTSVVVLGGSLRIKSMSTSGLFASSMMQQLQTDLAIVSGPAISADKGLMDSHDAAAALKRQMISSAGAVYALLDSSKVGARSFVSICSLAELDGMVTDSLITRAQLLDLDNGVTQVFIAESELPNVT